MQSPQRTEVNAGVPILFIRCPECRRHPVRFIGERGNDIALACEFCRHEWSRPSRRVGSERRQHSASPDNERRVRERRVGATARLQPARETFRPPSAPIGGFEIRGEVTVSEDYVLDSHLRGTLSVPGHTLTVATMASAVADLRARIVVVHGGVLGTITASDRIALMAGARVKGALATPVLVLEDGAEFTGRVERTSGERQ